MTGTRLMGFYGAHHREVWLVAVLLGFMIGGGDTSCDNDGWR